MFILDKVVNSGIYTCGGIENLEFSGTLPMIISTIVTIIKIAIPVILVIFGMLDLGKAVMAQKEDEIKKGQQTFIKRVIAAAIVFFVFFIVQIVVGLVASQDNVTGCMNCFLTGDVGTVKNPACVTK